MYYIYIAILIAYNKLIPIEMFTRDVKMWSLDTR